MKDNRKMIILNEIQFWKENNMLPKHYCDYLIALYTEGDENKQTITKKQTFNSDIFFSLLFLIMIGWMIVITYITDISFKMQTLSLVSFLLLLVIAMISFYKEKKNQLVIYITAAFLLLLYSVQINSAFFHNSTLSLFIMLIINSIIWIVGGIWGKRKFFVVSGLTAFVILVILIFI